MDVVIRYFKKATTNLTVVTTKFNIIVNYSRGNDAIIVKINHCVSAYNFSIFSERFSFHESKY